MARVIVTGGCGFLGQMLGRSILRRGALRMHSEGGDHIGPISELLLVDVARPETLMFSELEETQHDEYDDPALESRVVLGDIGDASFCKSLFAYREGPVSVFHLGAVMSGQGEADFDLAMRVNLHGTLNMLEAARHSGAPRPRVVMASAGATLGAGAPTDWVSAADVVSDATRATPHTTYGMTKSCAELLLADYSRRGFVDGRGLRLPTVVVRAGAPNAATTGCFSGVVREALGGVETVAPIGPSVRHAVTSHRTAVECFMQMHELEAAAVDATLGYDRTCFVPSTDVSLEQLHAATVAAVEPEARGALGSVRYDVDEELSRAVGSFPARIDSARAEALGMGPALDADGIVRAYAADFPNDLAAGVRLA